MKAKTKKELLLEVEDLRMRLGEAEESRRTLQVLMDHVPEGITIADAPESRIRMVSRYGRELLGGPHHGLTVEEVASSWKVYCKDGARLMPFEDLPLSRAIRHGETIKNEEIIQMNAKGERLSLLCSAAPIRNSAGSVLGGIVAWRNITEMKKTQDALRESEERFKLLSDTASQLLRSTEPQGIVSNLCRQVMEHLQCHVFFNFLVNEKVGNLHLNAFAGIPEEEAKKIEWLDYGVAVCGCVARDGERIVAEDIFRTPDIRTDLVKSYGVQAYCCHPLMVQERLIGTLSFGTKTRTHFLSEDVALMKTVADQVSVAMERMRLIEQLRASRDELEIRVSERTAELESRNQELQDFAFVASHDLQEPLRKVQTFGDMLLKKSAPSLGEEGRDYIQRMQRATGRMQKLLESLLSYSRVTTKAEPFAQTNLRKSVQAALSNLEIMIKEKNARVKVDDLPIVEADRPQMIQLFQNLIANALKFQRENETPLVSIYSRGSRNGSGHEICVEDNGIGFEEKYLDKIFMPFQRLHGRSGYEGVGMGLAICKKIVERHAGEITARSELGKGSTFIVIFPAKRKKR
jgi:signal transduction histidine kinase/PAS domain-containing protein